MNWARYSSSGTVLFDFPGNVADLQYGNGIFCYPRFELTMALFVHLAPESRIALIRRNGIRRLRKAHGEFPGGVFAMPVTRSFLVSHQWLRELKRRGTGAIAGVYFRIADAEQVWVGHYNRAHRWMSAAEAHTTFLTAEDRQGWEVIIPRRIERDEIHRVRHLPQVVGWRYWPGTKGKPPFCTCRFCTRGDYGARRLRSSTRLARRLTILTPLIVGIGAPVGRTFAVLMHLYVPL